MKIFKKENNHEIKNPNNQGHNSSEFSDSPAIDLLEAKIIDLQLRINELESDRNTIFNIFVSSIDTNRFIDMIRNENDYVAWFRYLKEMVSRFLVVMVVRDTPGSNMPKNIYKSIIEAGFSNFRTDLWNSYIGVFNQGRCWFDERKTNEEKTRYFYESMDGRFSILAKSETWRNGDCGEVYINGKQMSDNKRGVNIVVFDILNNQIVDSVSFDSHDLGVCILSRKK